MGTLYQYGKNAGSRVAYLDRKTVRKTSPLNIWLLCKQHLVKMKEMHEEMVRYAEWRSGFFDGFMDRAESLLGDTNGKPTADLDE